MKWLVLLVGIVVVSGCVGEEQSATTTPTTTIIDKYKYCENDSDCMLVNGFCCGCGGAGYRLTISKRLYENWSKEVADKCPEVVACPPMMSTHISCFSEPLCINNTCTLVPSEDVKASEISKCGNITNNYDKPRCYVNLSVDRKDVSICDAIPEEFEKYNFKNMCRQKVALETKNYRVCDMIDNGRDKALCYNEVAVNTDNPSICDLIPEDYGVKYECYIHFSGIQFRDNVNETVIKKIFYCENDSDCLVVQSDCCDCNNGGENMAVAKGFNETWEQALTEKCSDKACAAVISEHPTCFASPICLTNRCTLTPTTKISPLPKNISFETILLENRRCKTKTNGSFIIRDKNAFNDIWIPRHGDLPEIDFSKKVILAVFNDRIYFGGKHGITNILEMEDKVVVLFDRIYQMRGGMHPGRTLTPCHMVVINKTEKPIVFVENRKYCTEDSDCIRGAKEPLTYEYFEWCHQNDCISERGYEVQFERYDFHAQCDEICHQCLACECMDNICTVSNWTDECC